MEVEYSLTLKDVRAFTSNQSRHSAVSSKTPLNVTSLLIGGFIFTTISSFFVEKPEIQALLRIANLLLIGALIGTILSALNVLLVIRRSADRYFKDPRNRYLFGSRRLSIATEGVTIVSEGFRDFLPWRGVVDLVVTSDQILFFTGSINAQVVPQHAFRDEQHFQEFVELARRYHEAALPPLDAP